MKENRNNQVLEIIQELQRSKGPSFPPRGLSEISRQSGLSKPFETSGKRIGSGNRDSGDAKINSFFSQKAGKQRGSGDTNNN